VGVWPTPISHSFSSIQTESCHWYPFCHGAHALLAAPVCCFCLQPLLSLITGGCFAHASCLAVKPCTREPGPPATSASQPCLLAITQVHLIKRQAAQLQPPSPPTKIPYQSASLASSLSPHNTPSHRQKAAAITSPHLRKCCRPRSWGARSLAQPWHRPRVFPRLSLCSLLPAMSRLRRSAWLQALHTHSRSRPGASKRVWACPCLTSLCWTGWCVEPLPAPCQIRLTTRGRCVRDVSTADQSD